MFVFSVLVNLECFDQQILVHILAISPLTFGFFLALTVYKGIVWPEMWCEFFCIQNEV